MVRGFFWDDEFRGVWDDMLIFTKTLEECKETGSAIVQWVRKVCSRLSTYIINGLSIYSMGVFVGSWSPMIFHWLLCIHYHEFSFHLWCMLIDCQTHLASQNEFDLQ